MLINASDAGSIRPHSSRTARHPRRRQVSKRRCPETQRRRGQMKRMRTKILGGASIAGFAVAATLALAPAAHAEAAGIGIQQSSGINFALVDGSVRDLS
jgi:hypothetical protein